MTAFYGDSDIGPMLKDVGVTVVAGSVHSFGALDLEDQLVVQDRDRGEVVATVPSVTVQTSAFTASLIAIDAAVTVDGVNYTVRAHGSSTDGALKKLYLRKA